MSLRSSFANRRSVTACLMVASLLVCGSRSWAQPAVGQDAKSFTLETVDGGEVSLSDYLGETPILLAFISISCFECDETIPVVAQAIDKYQQSGKLQVMFIALANKRGAQWIARSGKYDVRAPLLVEKVAGGLLQTADDYSVMATPTLLVIGRDGKIRWAHMGRVDFEVLDAELEKVVRSNP